MARATVSPKFQIVIPKEIRERYELKPGQQLALIDRGGYIALVPQRPHLRAARHPQGCADSTTTVTRPTGTERAAGARLVRSGSSTSAEGRWPTECGRVRWPREREIVTPVQVLFEVYRWASAQRRRRRSHGDRHPPGVHALRPGGRDDGRGRGVNSSDDHALAAADAMIYATARLHRCDLVTADADFRGLPGVILLEEQTAGGDEHERQARQEEARPGAGPADPGAAGAAGHAASARGRATPTPPGASAFIPRSSGSSAPSLKKRGAS